MIDPAQIRQACEVLHRGGVVAFPTETVYGLGADARNEAAVRRIYAIKGRPAEHPLIVHLGHAEAAGEWAADLPQDARVLAERFWPGPLTMLLRRGPQVSRTVTGGQDTVGLRVPAHPVALALLRSFGGGIAAPSANRFGRVSPTTSQHVRDDLGNDVDFILEGGACVVGVESTILDLTAGPPSILRPGGITREQLEVVLGRPMGTARPDVRAPGLLEQHYAPRAEVIIVEPAEIVGHVEQARTQGRRVACLTMGECRLPDGVLRYSLPGEKREMARALYSTLREIDRQRVELLLVTLPDEGGLGRAIVDRLRRASGPRPGS